MPRPPTRLAPPGWVARCTSASRDAPLECAVEQTAVLTKTGQLIVLVNIRVAGDTRAADRLRPVAARPQSAGRRQAPGR